ncbi:hypothetical protein [Rhizohabitans arisaemae]|uniref:hypothetical protein n=1 Tax=Rhizohabitans arisaemae TaxID=2720610 RepID=UPI0024B24BF9|nr:hypothetical protein [Rhizohabitans arisaemae]
MLEPTRVRRVTERELASLLRTGPFEHALRSAIQSRGLSLERIHARLRERGVTVSLASLSNWQRGRSRPERETSLLAVRFLEDILGLPNDALVTLLGPRRPRGRWLDHVPGSLTFQDLCPVYSNLDDLLTQIESPVDGQLAWLSHHDRVRIGAAREELVVQSRVVFQARRDGVDRHVAIHYNPRGALPSARRVTFCRPGRVRADPDAGLVAVELLLDRPLRAGETYVLEYEFGYATTGPEEVEFSRGFRFPVREYLLQVLFDPTALPTRTYRVWQSRANSEKIDLAELSLDGWNSAHLIEFDVEPGVHGIRWEWD